MLVPMTDVEEAVLIARARARGTTPEALLRAAIETILENGALPVSSKRTPLKSYYGALAKYGPAPSAEDIDESRAEMFAPSRSLAR